MAVGWLRTARSSRPERRRAVSEALCKLGATEARLDGPWPGYAHAELPSAGCRHAALLVGGEPVAVS